MIINLDDPNPAVKIFLEKESDTAAYVMLRPAPSDILSEIREQTHTRRFKNIRGKIHEYFDIDQDLYDLKLWKYCMPEWGNIKDQNGNKIPHSPEKAVWLLGNSPYFSNIIGEKLDIVKDMIEKRMKEVKEN